MTAIRTSDTAFEKPEAAAAAPTSYTIRSRESFQSSSWLWWLFTRFTVLVVPLIAVTVTVATATDSFWSNSEISEKLQQFYDYYYETYKDDNFIIAVAAFAIFVVALQLCNSYRHFSTTRSQTRDIDLSLIVCPLGIQRSKTTTTICGQNLPKKVNIHHYPLLPIESIKDCILLEHVGGFSVTTHVMIRLLNNSNNNTKSKKLSNILESTTGEEKDALEAEKTKDAVSGQVAAFPDANLTFNQCHGLVKQIGRALEEVRW